MKCRQEHNQFDSYSVDMTLFAMNGVFVPSGVFEKPIFSTKCTMQFWFVPHAVL